MQDQGVRCSDDLHTSSISNDPPHLLFNLRARFDSADHDRGRCLRRHDVCRLTAPKHADIESSLSEHIIVTPVCILAIFEDGPQILDRGDAHFRIAGVRSAPGYTEIRHQGAFLRACELVLCRLADDDIFGIPFERIRRLRADAIGLLTD